MPTYYNINLETMGILCRVESGPVLSLHSQVLFNWSLSHATLEYTDLKQS